MSQITRSGLRGEEKTIADLDLDMIGRDMAAGLGPTPSQLQFCFAAYATATLAFRL